MPYPRTLPDGEGLARLIRRHRRDTCPIRGCIGQKHTYREIAIAFGVHPSAVYQAMRRHGLTDEGSRVDHVSTLPWTVRTEHRYKRPAGMLRLYARVLSGDTLPTDKRRMLVRWLRDRYKAGEVVSYDPATPPNPASNTGGWSYVPREGTDADLIRPPDDAPEIVYADPVEQSIWRLDHLTAAERRLENP